MNKQDMQGDKDELAALKIEIILERALEPSVLESLAGIRKDFQKARAGFEAQKIDPTMTSEDADKKLWAALGTAIVKTRAALGDDDFLKVSRAGMDIIEIMEPSAPPRKLFGEQPDSKLAR